MPIKRSFDPSVKADPATGLYDTKTLAEGLGVAPSTVRSLQGRGQVPAPTSMIGRRSVWSQEDVFVFYNISDAERYGKTFNLVPINPKLPKVVDLFSGCGGLSLGFQKAGFEVLSGYDNWPCAVDTYRANMGHDAYLLDLGDVGLSIETLEEHLSGQETMPAIIGGPPCQDFSSAGKRQEGARADLTEKYAQIVAHFNPPFFVMENVARAQHAAAFKSALSIMESVGYKIHYQVIDSSRVGVPQIRKRLITFGSKSQELADSVAEALVENQSEQQMTIRQYFEDVLKRPLDVDYYYRHPRSYARRGIFSIDEPSPTIRGVNRPIPSGYPGHKGDAGPIELARPLTTEERALIQTFPETFTWVGARTNIEQMVGNAVPVELGTYIATQIAQSLTDKQVK